MYTCTCTCRSVVHVLVAAWLLSHLPSHTCIGGSFRHFLWQVVRELQSSVLPVLLPCPSGATGVNHGRYILATGPMTFSEEKLLQFFGQVRRIISALKCHLSVTCMKKYILLYPFMFKSYKIEICLSFLSVFDLSLLHSYSFWVLPSVLTCQ